MSIKIYFDMDGVLNDFDVAVKPYVDASAALNKPTDQLTGDAAAAKRDMWHHIERVPDFWANIPMMRDIRSLLMVAKSYGELFVLTKAPSARHFVTGEKYVEFVDSEKHAWITRNLSEFFAPQNVIVTRTDKEKVINPTENDILIDDRAGNVANWVAAGGRGVWFQNVHQAITDLTALV